MRTIEIAANGFTFRARVDGPPQGRLVLLLHGFPQSSYEWRDVMPALARAGYRVVAPDLRGYSPGARPMDVDAYAANELAADVPALADALGSEQVDVVGHDWGAAIAWQVASRHRDRVRSLTAVSVPHPLAFSRALRDDADQKEKSAYMLLFAEPPDHPERVLSDDEWRRFRAMFAGSGLSDDDIDVYVEGLSEPGALTAALNYYRAAGRGLTDGMGAITCPTLFVWSSGDMALGRSAAEETGQYVDGPYRFEVLDGITHWVPEQAADTLTSLLLDHLETA